jgi:STE20-like kinase
MKHQRQLEESRASSAAAIKELEQLQNEKRKMLMEHETQKLRELDDSYSQEVREWKGQLKPRKQVILQGSKIGGYLHFLSRYYFLQKMGIF